MVWKRGYLLLFRSSANEDASGKAGHKVAADSKTGCHNVGGAVLHAVLLSHPKDKSLQKQHLETRSKRMSVRASHMLVLD